MTAWNDHMGRPRHESGGRELALPGVPLVSPPFANEPVSFNLDPVGNSSLGRLGGGSLSCDSAPLLVKSTTVD